MAEKLNSFSFEDVLRRERRGYTSMCKPVGSMCNMRCKYCYYLDKAALYGGHEPQMNDELLEAYIRNTIEGNNAPVISFAWHGGEPLLAGIDFFRKAMVLQKKYAEGKPIENSIQTNGLLINSEWCSFLRDNNFLVGISIDGPQDIHDAHRLDAGGNGTFTRVMLAIEQMARSGVEYNTLSTVNIHSVGRGADVYKFLRGISQYMQFLPVAELISDQTIQSPDNRNAEIAPWSIPSRAFGEFMCDIFDLWVTNDVGSRFVQLFDSTLANYVGVQPSICTLCDTCGTGLTVEHNGDTYSCDHFVYPDYLLGNIKDIRLCDMAYSKRQFDFGVLKRESLPRDCRRCRYFTLCRGECPKHRFIKDSTDEYGKNYLCDGYKLFFRHTAPYMEYIKNLLILKKPPRDVMRYAMAHPPKKDY